MFKNLRLDFMLQSVNGNPPQRGLRIQLSITLAICAI